MRLVLVTETFPPDINGVARTLGRWADAFRARTHVVHVIRPRSQGEAAGANLVHGMPLPFYRQVRVGVASPVTLWRRLRQIGPDLVHIATEGPLGLSALLACHWLGVPVASSFHTNFDHYAAHYGLAGLARLGFAYLRWFHNRTHVTLVPSQATAPGYSPTEWPTLRSGPAASRARCSTRGTGASPYAPPSAWALTIRFCSTSDAWRRKRT